MHYYFWSIFFRNKSFKKHFDIQIQNYDLKSRKYFCQRSKVSAEYHDHREYHHHQVLQKLKEALIFLLRRRLSQPLSIHIVSNLLHQSTLTNIRTDKGGNSPYPASSTPLCKLDPALSTEFGNPDPIAAGFGTCWDLLGRGRDGIPCLRWWRVTSVIIRGSCWRLGSVWMFRFRFCRLGRWGTIG